MSLFQINLGGAGDIRKFLLAAPGIAQMAARDAVNGAIRFGYAESSRLIRKEVNLPQDYIGSVAAGNRLKVSRYATLENLEGTISAAQRAVSLARFANDRTLGGKNGVVVQVKPGNSRRIATAFLIKLKSGSAAVTTDSYNIGLAIRLKKGQKVFNKTKLVPYGNGDPDLYLVYGPSVDQVFRDVRVDVEPAIIQFLGNEFFRQFDRQVR